MVVNVRREKWNLLRQFNISQQVQEIILNRKDFFEALVEHSILNVDSRNYTRSIKGGKNLNVLCPGGQIIPMFLDENCNWQLILQIRSTGEIGALGGACDLYFINPGFELENDKIDVLEKLVNWEKENNMKVPKVPEPVFLSALREIQEEGGIRILETDKIEYLCEAATINHYEGFPDVHGYGTYYRMICDTKRFSELSQSLKKYDANEEGKPVVMSLKQLMLNRKRWFENAKYAFEIFEKSLATTAKIG